MCLSYSIYHTSHILCMSLSDAEMKEIKSRTSRDRLWNDSRDACVVQQPLHDGGDTLPACREPQSGCHWFVLVGELRRLRLQRCWFVLVGEKERFVTVICFMLQLWKQVLRKAQEKVHFNQNRSKCRRNGGEWPFMFYTCKTLADEKVNILLNVIFDGNSLDSSIGLLLKGNINIYLWL